MKHATLVALSLALATSAHGELIAGWNLALCPDGAQTYAATAAAGGVTGMTMTRGAGLGVAFATQGNFNAWGWNQEAADYLSFGFTVANGSSVNLSTLQIGTRSEGGAPGVLALRSSVDGFGSDLFIFNQAATDGGVWGPGAGFIFSVIDLSALTNLTGTVEFRIYQVGNTAANGGTPQTNRHFRLTNYFYGGIDQGDMSFSGTVVPAPGALALLGLGGLVGGRRRR
jgi:MYXO-CTERM domain-containing protein